MRMELKLLRVKNNLTQGEMAQKIGCSRATYSMIERGERSGTFEFWKEIQNTFEIPDSQMFSLMQIYKGANESEEQEEDCCKVY